MVKLTFQATDKNYANGYTIALVPSNNETLIFDREIVWFHDKTRHPSPDRSIIGTGNKETNLVEVSRSTRNTAVADYVIHALRSWKVYHFHDTSDSSPIKGLQRIDENHLLQGDASNIAAYLYLLREQYPHNYKQIVRTVKRVAPFFDDFALRRSPLNQDNIRLQWKDVNSDNIFNAASLSDGTLRFICLATLLLQPEELLPSVILIDEPELGLHPYAMTLLASLLRSAAAKTQVIVSTQSVPLVNQFEPKDILAADRIDGQSTFRALDDAELEKWMTEYSGYGLGDLWEKNILGGRPQPEMR